MLLPVQQHACHTYSQNLWLHASLAAGAAVTWELQRPGIRLRQQTSSTATRPSKRTPAGTDEVWSEMIRHDT